MIIFKSQLPCSEAEFMGELAAYIEAKAEANKVAGSPAPFPKYELIRVLAERGDTLQVVEEVIPEGPQPTATRPAE